MHGQTIKYNQSLPTFVYKNEKNLFNIVLENVF